MQAIRVTLFTLIPLLFAMSAAHGQSPASGRTITDLSFTDKKAGAPPSNPWLRAGAQVGYAFASKGAVDEVSDFFAARTEVYLIKPDSSRFAMPIIGNFGKIDLSDIPGAVERIQQLAASSNGAQVLFAPYYSFGTEATKRTTTLYANGGYKWNRVADASAGKKDLHQFRASIGLDFNYYLHEDLRPFSFVIEPVYAYIGKEKAAELLGKDESYIGSLELTVMAPLATVSDVGVLLQGVALKGGKPMWRLGLITFKNSQ